MHQLKLPFNPAEGIQSDKTYCETLVNLLSEDLDFHGQDSGYASHNFHSFPAKFPPQMPRKFIAGLTCSNDTILDPMSGSGTTVLEAFLAGRQAFGFDIDPLALLIRQVKITALDIDQVLNTGNLILKQSTTALNHPNSVVLRP